MICASSIVIDKLIDKLMIDDLCASSIDGNLLKSYFNKSAHLRQTMLDKRNYIFFTEFASQTRTVRSRK